MNCHDLVKQFLIDKGFNPKEWTYSYFAEIDFKSEFEPDYKHRYVLWPGAVWLNIHNNGRIHIDGMQEFQLDVTIHDPNSLQLLEDAIYRLHLFLGKIMGNDASRNRFYASKEYGNPAVIKEANNGLDRASRH